MMIIKKTVQEIGCGTAQATAGGRRAHQRCSVEGAHAGSTSPARSAWRPRRQGKPCRRGACSLWGSYRDPRGGQDFFQELTAVRKIFRFETFANDLCQFALDLPVVIA